MPRSMIWWASWLLIFALAASFGAGEALGDQPADPKDGATTIPEFKKEALQAIKDMTTNLLFLAVGVFALVGGFLEFGKKIRPIWPLWPSLSFFGISLIGGLVVFMALIGALGLGNFEPDDPLITVPAGVQIVTVGIGSLFFFLFLVLNIGKDRP